jgi:hypothetical protein
MVTGPQPGLIDGESRVSQVPGEPSAMFSDPGVTKQTLWVQVRAAWRGPRVPRRRGLTATNISGLNRTAFDLAVYASR